jgi:hypothetical protein
MENFKPLMDQLYQEEVEQARRQSPQERVRSMFELSDMALEIMRCAIRDRFPNASKDELLRRSRERLARIREVEDRGIFVDAGR